VLGVLPGLVGCVQALEAIKLILGQGTPLVGRMMHFDTLAGEVRTLRLRRDPGCAVCGDRPTITQLIDYEMFCGLGGGDGTGDSAGHPAEPARAPSAA
jgi:adenylyltransferase/sulfurtransferase